MAKVKVFLDKDESELDAHIALHKALDIHTSGDVHLKESFDDPAMVHASQRFEEIHSKIYKEMMDEILDELDKEFEE